MYELDGGPPVARDVKVKSVDRGPLLKLSFDIMEGESPLLG